MPVFALRDDGDVLRWAMLYEGRGRTSPRTSSLATENCAAMASQSRSSANLLHIRPVYDKNLCAENV